MAFETEIGKLLTVPEAADSLGIRPQTLRLWMCLGKIGFVKIGRLSRIPEAEIRRKIVEGLRVGKS